MFVTYYLCEFYAYIIIEAGDILIFPPIKKKNLAIDKMINYYIVMYLSYPTLIS